jgi:antitoxin (DNA-binding transcriptional repressor) of toxin-antitoxin stability system
MKPLTVGVLKSRFSEVLKEVQSGEEMAMAFDKK